MSETLKNVLDAAIMGLIAVGLFGVGLTLMVMPIVFWGTAGVAVDIGLCIFVMVAAMFYSDVKRGRTKRIWFQ